MAEQTDTGAMQTETGTKQVEAGAAWENPLIPNARLRQMYRLMAQARALGKALPAAKRGQTHGLEAVLVCAAVDLGPGDLVSDALAGRVVDYLRGTALSEVLRAGKVDVSLRCGKRGTGGRGRAEECGAAGRLPGAADAAERIWTALGAAAALKAAAAQSLSETKEIVEGGTARQAGVVVAYALPDEVSATLWRKTLRFAAEQELPVVFVVLPGARDGKARGARAGKVSALARGCGLPAIVVDADDAVAIYRVAQESIGRARAGGGAALIECVPFVLEGTATKRTAANDAVAELERHLLQRGIASKAWMEREAKAFAKRVAR